MAFQEYYDLFLLAQEKPNALYYVVSFDTVNSKSLSVDKRTKLTYNIIAITKYVYDKLLMKEKELNKQVVINDERFYTPWDSKELHMTNGNYEDPSILGDFFAFTVLRDTITKEEIIDWVNECKIILKMDEEFHISDGYYETNEYGEGNTKLYRGYCLQILEKIHKQEVQEELENVKNKMKIR